MAELTDLPIDVLILILLPLPAKLLTQLKTLCILFSQIINSPNFIHLHFHRTLTLTPSENPNRCRFVFCSRYLYSADFDTFSNITQLDHLFRRSGYCDVEVVGSIYGLLCLHNYPNDLSIYLYNPTNRTHKKLPFLCTPVSSFSYYFGFGYDSESRDFKFVRILTSSDENEPFWSQVMVYSLRADSWTRIGDSTPPRLSPRREHAVFVHGNLHWVVNRSDGEHIDNSIVSFSLSDYKFNQVPQPPYEEQFVQLHIGVLDGCLCVLANDLFDTDVWVMKEYGVLKTWTRLYKIKRDPILHLQWPIAFSVNRRELFLQAIDWQVVSLNLKTLEVNEVQVADFRRCYDTYVCMENLMILKDDPECGRKRKRRTRCRRRRGGRSRHHQEVQN